MEGHFTVFAGLIIGFAVFSSAQTFQTQVNITICNWRSPRVGIIRDTLYADGGSLWWRRGLSDGTYGEVKNDGNPDGDIFTLPLSTPFDTAHTNLTGLFGRLKTVNGAADSFKANYIDGAMFSSDNEFILYGGLNRLTGSNPYADQAISYERYFWGPAGATSWRQGFVQSRTNHNVTRYITHGASVSVPSENRGYYFSGMRGQNWGEIAEPEPKANQTANSLISVDMTEWRNEQWFNTTLPPDIPPRGKAELSWIPVSNSGVLVAIGGVPYPQDVLGGRGPTQDQEKDNSRLGASFMKTVPVYDIGSDKWYLQNTTGDIPPVRSDFCSVVASAKDGSSHNIYIYGGYGGSNRVEKSSDDVYVLSLPSFTWIKAPQGRNEHGRRGHRCVKVFPDQMFVLGGQFIDPTTCLDGGVIQVFNLNTLQFQNVYDPTKWEDYQVPAAVRDVIGGRPDGGATTTKPASWNDNDLAGVFSRKYSKPVKTYYPYKVTETPTQTPSAPPPPSGGGLPKWVGPVLGVVLGLIFITGLAVIWLLWRRRKEKRDTPSVGATSDNRNRVMRWMYGTGMPGGKNLDASTTTATESGHPPEKHLSSEYSEAGNDATVASSTRPGVAYFDLNEAASSPVHELHDSSSYPVVPHPGLGATVSAPLELPTEYNSSPVSPRPRYPSDAGSLQSPVSPEPGAISPPVSPPPELPSTRPAHNRHNSSLSSTGFPTSLNNAVATDNRGSAVINEEDDLQRERFVSGITEDFSDSEESHHEGPEVKTW